MSRYKGPMNQPTPTTAGHPQLTNFLRAAGVLALLSFVLPWVASGAASGARGIDLMGGIGTDKGAPSIPLILA